MYYEEKYENGLWYWRGTPDGAWIEMGTRMLSEKLAAAQREVAVTERNLCDAMNALHKSEREIAAWRQSVDELLTGKFASEIKHRVRELLAQEGGK